MRIQVECYSGFKGQERPLRFILGDRALDVEAIEDQWYSPDLKYFRVKASDGNTYVLSHNEGQDYWTLEVYRLRENS